MASQLDPVYEQSFGVHTGFDGLKISALHAIDSHVYPALLKVHDEPCATVLPLQLPLSAVFSPSQVLELYEQSFGVHVVEPGMNTSAWHVIGVQVCPGFVKVH